MLTGIRLINCQSWEDCAIDLRPNKLNIIQAPNNTGKSVLFKIFKVVVSPKFYPPKKRKKLIRWGCECAKAAFAFDDDTQAVVIIHPTKNIYLVQKEPEGEFIQSYEPPQKLIDNLGFLVNEKGTFIANIIDADQKLLLVDADAKGTYEFIDMLCNNASLTEYKEKLTAIQQEVEADVTQTEFELLKINSELEKLKFVDVERMERDLELTKTAKDTLYKCISLAKKIHGLSSCLQYSKDYGQLEKILGMIETLESFKLSECYTEDWDSNSEHLIAVLECLENLGFNTIALEKEPIGMDLLNLLDILEDIRLEKVQVEKYPIGIDVLSTLETLEKIDLDSINIGTRPVGVELTDFLSKLEVCNAEAKRLSATMNAKEEYAQSVNELTEAFKNSGTEYECAIHGRVIFDGENCIPYNT